MFEKGGGGVLSGDVMNEGVESMHTGDVVNDIIPDLGFRFYYLWDLCCPGS